MTEECEDTCGQPRGDHFTSLSLSAIAAVDDLPEMADCVNSLAAHGWLRAAVRTWTLLFGRYGVPQGADPAACELDVEGPPCGADHPWVTLTHTMLWAAVRRFPHNAQAAVDVAFTLPRDQLRKIVPVLLRSTHVVLSTQRTLSRHSLHLMHLFGYEATTPDKYAVVDDLTDLTAAYYEHDDAEVARLLAVLQHYDLIRLLAAFSVSTAAMGALMADDDPEVNSASGPLDPSGPGQLIDWRDRTTDGQRSLEELAACWSVRAAVAYRQNDSEQVKADFERSENPGEYLYVTTQATVQFIALRLVEQDMQVVAEHGTPPPPGHPG